MPSAADLGPSLDEVCSRQCDVVTREQLAAGGVSHDIVRSQVRAGRWQLAGARIVVLHNGPLTPEQARWRAVLGQPHPAALAALTAAQCYGLAGFEATRIHVVTAARTALSRFPDTVVHVSRRFTARHVHPTRRPPMVRLERAVIDAAAWERSRRRAAGLVAAAVQQRLTTPQRLTRELRRAGQVRHRRLLAAVLADLAGGAHSLAEIDLVRVCRLAGLAAPSRQVVRSVTAGGGRRRYYLDAHFGGFTVEVDGQPHFVVAGWVNDTVRQNELVILGDRVLRVPSLLLRTAPELVADQLRRAHLRYNRP
jgi:hypothetical protein